MWGAASVRRAFPFSLASIIALSAGLGGPGAPVFAATPGHWTQLHPLLSPSERGGAGLAYDAATGSAVLFGGFSSTAVTSDGSGDFDQTWLFSNGNWSQAHPATSPSRRVAPKEAYDPARGFGFILPNDGGKDIFVHVTALRRSGIEMLEPGQPVRMMVSQARRGREAGSIELA